MDPARDDRGEGGGRAAGGLSVAAAGIAVGIAEENQLGLLYELIRAYERADRIRTAAISEGLKVNTSDVSSAYVTAVEWADAAAKD